MTWPAPERRPHRRASASLLGVVRRLLAKGWAGTLVPSFAAGATADDENLAPSRWGPALPHKRAVYGPMEKLPKNQLSWS